MLVLSRKSGESIKIGDDIEITILSTKNDQIKIGIKAPKTLEIFRTELLEQISEENVQAANVQSNILNLIKRK
jgi:carbon storage regulator